MGTVTPRLLILGVGNILLQDEGVGVHAVKELMKRTYPPEVELIDGGTAGMDLLYLIEDVTQLIMIDAVNGDGAAGTIYKFEPEELDEFIPNISNSLHDIGVLEVLHLGKAMGVLPPTVVYGMQPAVINWGTELSPAVAAGLSNLVMQVDKDIEDWLAVNSPVKEALQI
ncbi:MAG: HyaD/HybD family hydrogenase maturation endopeptidase [Bacillota bacterium]